MFKRPTTWMVICLLSLAGSWYFWQLGERWAAERRNAPSLPAAGTNANAPASAGAGLGSRMVSGAVAAAGAELTPLSLAAQAVPMAPGAYRLRNTTRSLQELLREDRAVLLENALVDTAGPVDLGIPDHLRAGAEAGTYIVQARGPVDAAFREQLRAAGAAIVAYIPNHAYLVRVGAAGAAQLAAAAGTQAVLPYEPYYKLKSTLLRAAVKGEPLPAGSGLKVMLFADAAAATQQQLAELGAEIVVEESSPFGPVVRLRPPAGDWVAVARLPGVQTVEWYRPRLAANDLSRVRVAVSSAAQIATNHLGLTGANVLVSVNDSWEFTAVALPEHPDLVNRVFPGTPYSLVDSNGHATHVAGSIAGSGLMSTTVTNARGSLNPGVDGQYRGVAPGAKLYALPLGLGARSREDFVRSAPDTYLQESAALTNALISNNGWHYINSGGYDLAAASYDAAVRDALPGVTGSQPVLFVFAAGNDGGGGDQGLEGDSDTIRSPGTAKNVITVGALEQPRDITNEVILDYTTCVTTNMDGTNVTICATNTPWRGMTSSASELARFSSRGNTGIGIEGESGRFKPDVVAPGTFVVSARSQYWDEKAYYNPTNHTIVTRVDEVVAGTNQNYYSVFVPENAVALNLTVLSAQGQRLRVWQGKDPSLPPDLIKLDNRLTAPPDGGANFGPVNTTWWYSVANTNSAQTKPPPTNTYTILRDLVTTNDLGNYYEVLSNLNNSISGGTPHYYRYESGTSMAAAEVSGTLALMQEFFEQRLHRTNSPALMKALMINGARSAGPLYFMDVRSPVNDQGWGQARLRNSLPGSLTNFVNGGSTYSMWFEDQSPTNALATGQRRTYTMKVNTTAARNQPLRATLVWTDPPGSPAAGIKLVNDLDLVVTNLDSGEVFFGNQIETGSNFSTPWDTNQPPLLDVVNNVENVYLLPELGTNYTVTVQARHVNVNAVTAHPDRHVQDYALVLASGDGQSQVNGALTVAANPVLVAVPDRWLTYVTNTFEQYDETGSNLVAAGFVLDEQRVGANTPLLSTTTGITNQWHFYIVTNVTTFTNAAFVTFLPADLSIPRIGVREGNLRNATRVEADVDLYVSADFNLTNLAPAVVATARQSRSRNGTEQVVLSNAVANQIYYIGVKAEDQMAAEYSLFGVFSELPFGDTNGVVPCFNVPQPVPDRSPDNVQGQRNAARVICPCVLEGDTRRVVVTNSFIHERFEDLLGNLFHGEPFAVLNNHRLPPPLPEAPGPYQFIYEDHGEGDIVPAVEQLLLFTDGPGTLRDFVGEPRVGPWIFTFLDDAWTQTGLVSRVQLKVEEAVTGTNDLVLPPNSWRYQVVNVGVGATNLTICVGGNTQPVEVYVRRGSFPTRQGYDQFLVIQPPGDCLEITPSDLPPLGPGRYYIGVYNPGPLEQKVRFSATVAYDLSSIVPTRFSQDGDEPLLDDAVTNALQFVTEDQRIATVDVGVRLDHPRVSDLALTLISPRGTRVLLMENRGGTNDQGLGNSIYVTNVVPVLVTNGGPLAVTNTIDTGTSGTLTIDYDFFEIPDRMTVYYQNARLLDTGFISGADTLSVAYGPGSATTVDIVINEGGNPEGRTGYRYTVSDIGVQHNYVTFTEDTNRTTTPIKFALPPFQIAPIPFVFISGFEPESAGDYVFPAVVDGWDVLSSNRVSVLGDPLLANTGTKSLSLLSGEIQRNLATSPGRTYRLDFAYRKTPNGDDPINWWPAEGNTVDIVRGFNGQMNNGAGFATGFVAQAFRFDGVDDTITYGTEALINVTNSFTMEFWARPTAARTVTTETTSSTNVEGTDGQRYAIYPYNGEGELNRIVGAGVSVGTNGISVFEHSGFSLPSLLVYEAPISGWTHIAVVYQNKQPRLYVNGVLVRIGLTSRQNPCPSLRLGGGGSVFKPSYGHFRGEVDEYAIFDHALSAAQIQDIYGAGAAGKCGMNYPPTLCVPVGAQVFVPGVVTNLFTPASTNWVTNSFFFTTTAIATPVGLTSQTPRPSGVLLDDFTLTALPKTLDYLPEESLRVLEGEAAEGLWRLEIWDTRAGAVLDSTLLSWTLDFVFQNEFATPGVLQPGVPRTTTIPPGQIGYYVVDVPSVARIATNSLLAATGPVGFYFNQNLPPGYGATNVGDLVFTNGTSGTFELTPGSTPPLIPGQRYYLAVENKNSTNVNYTVLVDFDLRALPPFFILTNAVKYCAINLTPLSLDYYRFTVPTNAVRAQFLVRDPSADVTLLLRRELPPAFGAFDYISANPGSNSEVITVFDFTQPVPLTPGDWYFAVANLSPGPVTYCVQANQWTLYGTNMDFTITTNVNSLCFTWASLPDVLYYVEGSTDGNNWVTVSPTITATQYSTTFCIPLPTPFLYFRVRAGVAIDSLTFPPVITRIDRTFYGILLNWGGPTDARYQVQWKPLLDGTTNWNTFSNIISSPTGLFQFVDTSPQIMASGAARYYRLQQLLP